MENIEIKYRVYDKGMAPRKIKAEIPGWAGTPEKQKNGNAPQPWHCVPFIEGSTYGLEAIYPFDEECHVTNKNGKVEFSGTFSGPWGDVPPFASFAPGHYGHTSALDLKPPEGYVTRLEPHPRFFTDTTGTVPIVVPGHLQAWWPKIFFIVFKAPRPGETHIFRKGEPYAQILFLPAKVNYTLKEMTQYEIEERNILDLRLQAWRGKHEWVDHKGQTFNDKYKQLGSIHAKYGQEGLESFLLNQNAKPRPVIHKPKPIKTFIHENISNKTSGPQDYCAGQPNQFAEAATSASDIQGHTSITQ